MVLDPQVRAAALHLGDQLQYKSWFASVGIGDEGSGPVLIIYSRRKLPESVRKALPQQWEKFPVRLQKNGTVQPADRK